MSLALCHFRKLEGRLDSQLTLKIDYIKFMQEYLSLSHMKQIESEEPVNPKLPIYYLPHHCVFKPESSNTKLRVFDGSCKGSMGISLNDALKGPIIQ